jgi:dinuclear metal center YbgI/SA1388 family protein
LQEEYDNSGLLVGTYETEVTGILVSLDCTEAVVEEAILEKCNIIIAHHPIIFKGLKKLTGSNYIERTVIKAIQNNIAIYAIHTNLDHVHVGVNRKIGEKLGIKNMRILKPKTDTLLKLVTFIPTEAKDIVLNALYGAGAGSIGNYRNCSFQLIGEGTFTPNEDANPHIGSANKAEKVSEARIEVLLPSHLKNGVIQALKKSHPYEEVAYYLSKLENENQEAGAGMIGELDRPMDAQQFLKRLKTLMQTECVRHTPILPRPIQKIAWCGGAGSFLLSQAKSQKADVFISGDFKYHEFFDADGEIIIADIGHYESEQFTKDLLIDVLKENFTTFAIIFSKTFTNPISYL